MKRKARVLEITKAGKEYVASAEFASKLRSFCRNNPTVGVELMTKTMTSMVAWELTGHHVEDVPEQEEMAPLWVFIVTHKEEMDAAVATIKNMLMETVDDSSWPRC